MYPVHLPSSWWPEANEPPTSFQGASLFLSSLLEALASERLPHGLAVLPRANGASGSVRHALSRAAAATGIPERLLHAVATVESGLNPSARSPAGAIGLMQLMPSTAQALGVDPWDPVENALGGALYLKQQLERFGDLRLALAAYNAGPGRVAEAIRRAGSYEWWAVSRYLPQETRQYVRKVLSLYT